MGTTSSKHTPRPIEGPAERVFDGLGGTSQPLYRYERPCGCRTGGVRGSVCMDHYVLADRAIRDRVAARAAIAKAESR